MRKTFSSLFFRNFLVFLFFYLSLFFSLPSHGIENSKLEKLRQDISWLEEEIKHKKKEWKKALRPTEKKQFEKDIDTLTKTLDSTYNAFIQEIGGIDLQKIEDSPLSEENPKKDFAGEVYDVLSPMLQSLKKISSRPRQIQKLKEKLSSLSLRIEQLKQGIDSIEENLSFVPESVLKLAHNKKTKLEKTLKNLQLQESEVIRELESLEKNNESFLDKTLTSSLTFFKERGKNLLITFFVFSFLVWVFIKAKRRLFLSLKISTKYPSWERPLSLFYNLFAGLSCLCSVLLTLYFFNDWPLVSLLAITLMALLWSSRNLLPDFFQETIFMANLGSVREKERVIWNGVAWKVKTIGFFCLLENPIFENYHLRVKAKELMKLTSRPIIKGDSWFSCKKDDWIYLENKVCQVTGIFPEQVCVTYLNHSFRHFPLSVFLDLSPLNLNKGFSAEVILGLDYKHQPFVTKEIPQRLTTLMESKVKEANPTLFSSLRSSVLEFHSAGDHALNILCYYGFSGEAAPFYNRAHRLLWQCLVECCQEEGLEIAFHQLSVHLKKNDV